MTIKDVSEKFNISQDTLRYYERVGIIPPVTRNSSGIRDYTEKDLGWVSLIICMRNAGMPIEALTRYVKMCMEGDSTIPARLDLLSEQRKKLVEQRRRIDETISRLDYKIDRYRAAVESGCKDSWM